MKNDMFEATMSSQQDLINLVEAICSNDIWEEYPTTSLALKPLSNAPLLIAEEIQQHNFTAEVDESLIDDTMKGSQLILSIDNLDDHLLREFTTSDVLSRAGVSGAGLSRLKEFNLDNYTICLNHLLQANKKKTSVLIRGGKVTALHGQLDIDYVILDQRELLKITVEEMLAKKAVFLQGYYSHEVTEAAYELPHTVDTRTLEEYGISSDYTPLLVFRTSDTAYSSATLSTYIIDRLETVLPCGKPLKMSHRSGSSCEKFRELYSQTFSIFKDGMDRMIALTNIRINQPESAVVRIAEMLKIPTSTMPDKLATLSLRRELPQSAFDVYYFLCRCVSDMEISKGYKLILQESLLRALHLEHFEWNSALEQVSRYSIAA